MQVDERIASNYWFVNILVDNPELLQNHLKSDKIGSRRFFYPMHKQPCFNNEYSLTENNYPNTNYLYNHGLSLPSSPNLSLHDLNRVLDSIKKYK